MSYLCILYKFKCLLISRDYNGALHDSDILAVKLLYAGQGEYTFVNQIIKLFYYFTTGTVMIQFNIQYKPP